MRKLILGACLILSTCNLAPAFAQEQSLECPNSSTIGENAASLMALGLDFTIYSDADAEAIKDALGVPYDVDTAAIAEQPGADDDSFAVIGFFKNNCLVAAGRMVVGSEHAMIRQILGQGVRN